MKYTLLEKFLIQGLGFVQSIVLARLLTPGDFGLVAMLGVFLGLGGILAESGLGSAYVVLGGDARRVLKWNLGAACLLYLVLALCAPLIAAWYERPVLRELTWVMGLTVILYAASVVRVAALQRAKRFRMLSLANGSSVLAAFLVAVTCAACGCGVWSIVAGTLASGVVRLVVLCCAGSLAQEEGDFGRLLSFGWKSLVCGLVGTVYFHAFRLVIGKAFDPSAVGIFHRAQHWATLPGSVANEAVGRVALPSLTDGTGGGGRWLAWNCALVWPALCVLWIWATEIVTLVIGEQWLDAVPYLRIMIFGALFAPLANVAETCLKARERADLVLLAEVIKKPFQIAALVVGAFFGMTGLCWAVVAGEATSAAVNGLMVVRGGSRG